jgi:hypothetical protein
MKMNENNNNGLKHKECLQILFNQIHNELIKFKTERLKIRVIARSYFKENIFLLFYLF